MMLVIGGFNSSGALRAMTYVCRNGVSMLFSLTIMSLQKCNRIFLKISVRSAARVRTAIEG